MNGASATSLSPILAAGAAEKSTDFIASVHDVAPVTRTASEKIIAALSRRGIPVCSLLVVPDFHHHGLCTNDRNFVRWLRDLEAEGHEIVIHGYFHERPRRSDETLSTRFLTRVYTNDEGEFYDLDYAEAFRRITSARDVFRAAGLTPRGFIAPAWLLGAEAERAASDAEMEYTTRLRSVCDLRSGENFPARSLVYSVRSAWRRRLSLVWNGALARCVANSGLVRLSIHPPDYEHREIWQQILRFADALTPARTPTTYRDWIARKREGSGR